MLLACLVRHVWSRLALRRRSQAHFGHHRRKVVFVKDAHLKSRDRVLDPMIGSLLIVPENHLSRFSNPSGQACQSYRQPGNLNNSLGYGLVRRGKEKKLFPDESVRRREIAG